MTGPCCTPSDEPRRREAGAPDPVAPAAAAEGVALVEPDLVALEGGEFTMGTDGDYGYMLDGEGPAHPVVLSPFAICRYAVSNRNFAAFVAATGYRTEAERYGASFVFFGFLAQGAAPSRPVPSAPWWREVEGADWSRPEGPGSSWEGRPDHPVIHVSWDDARAFCAWSGTRLPTEAEWEYAARGGLAGCRFPWGEELEPGGEHRMNVWQGSFPDENTVADGYAGTAPVDAFEPNGFGLHNLTGNVWEWTDDRFDRNYYAASPREDPPGGGGEGPVVMRGGSYLCHASYCNRYRVDARGSNAIDGTTGNLGFRVVRGLTS
ncbi:MAG: formylglycine-generating enzyme family protein [Nitrososphaerota archaeon]